MSALSQCWKNIQGNLALEGHHISDEELEKVAEKYDASGDDQLIDQAVDLAEKSGRSFADLFEEVRKEKHAA